MGGGIQYSYAPTDQEFSAIKELAKKIYQLTEKKYGRGIIVKAPMLCSMNVLRRIRCLTVTENPPVIYELGGGSGVLGAMLHEAGYRYISTDVTQSFYLTQNNLWEGLYADSVEECLNSVVDFDTVDSDKIIHVPYWKLWDARYGSLKADIMVANHCLTEMHEWSLLFYLQYGRWLMRDSQYKLLIAQMPGSLQTGNIDYLLSRFHRMGYALIYSDQDFFIFCLRDKEGISPIDLNEFLQKCVMDYVYPVYKNPDDRTAAAYDCAYQRIQNREKVSIEEIEGFFSSLNMNVDSPDEEFMHYCALNWI